MVRSWTWMTVAISISLLGGCGGKKDTPTADASAASAGSSAAAPGPQFGSSDASSGDAGEQSAGGSVPAGGGSDSGGVGRGARSFGGGGLPSSDAGGYDAAGAGYPGGSEGMPGYPGAGGMPGGAAGMQGGALGGFGAMLSGLMGKSGPPPRKKLSLKERADLAFEAGNTTRAYQLLIGHGLVGTEEDAVEIANFYRWAPQAKRPTLGLNVAVGMVLKNPSKVTDLKPIGTDFQQVLTPVPLPNAPGGVGGGGSSEGGLAAGIGAGMSSGGPETQQASSVRAKQLASAAGTLASELFDEFGTQHEAGHWTIAFQEKSLKDRPGVMGGSIMGLPGSGAFGAPGEFGGSSEAGYGNPGGFPGGEPGSFPGAPGMGRRNFWFPQSSPAGMSTRGMGGMGAGGVVGSDAPGYSANSDGSAFGGDSSAMPGQNFGGNFGGNFGQGRPGFGPPPPALVEADFKLPEGVIPVAACFNYIGEGEQSELVKKAYTEGYDAIVLFDIEIKLTQMRTVNNATRVKVLVPAEVAKDSIPVVSSKELTNAGVARAKAKNEADGVEAAAATVAKKTAESIGLIEIPDKLTTEAIVTRRIPALMNEGALSKIEKLGEVNYYYAKGYIDEAQRDGFFKQIVGGDVRKLVYGEQSDRMEALDALLND